MKQIPAHKLNETKQAMKHQVLLLSNQHQLKISTLPATEPLLLQFVVPQVTPSG